MLPIVYRECPSRQSAAEVIFGHIVLNGAQQNVNHRLGDGNQLQGSVSRPLAGESCPALKRAKHRTDRGRFHFLHLGTEGGSKGTVLPPIAVEHVTVHLAEILVEPTLD